MNKYDEYYNFRLANIDDVDKIMKFIHDEWGENHILAHNRELFVWQYGRTEYDDYENINWVLMEDKTGNMVGGIGFVAYSNNPDRLHISQAITKVKADGMLPMSGIELMKRQMDLVKEKETFSYGTNPETIKPIWEKKFHNEVGVMQQFYMLNENFKEYHIAGIKDKIILEPKNFEMKMDEIEKLDDDIGFEREYKNLPYKSKAFLIKRYWEHPIYRYKKWRIKDKNDNTKAYVFAREITVEDRTILRIVDFRGELKYLYSVGAELNKLMKKNNYEYIDVMASGLSEKEMANCGFALLNLEGKNIIPNYFEPYEQRNIKIWYQKSGEIVIFKADGDQDRPNKI